MTLNRRYTRRSFLAGMGALAAGIKLAPSKVFAGEDAKLSFFNWDRYIGETTLDDFQKESGIDVSMSIFPDSQHLFDAIADPNSEYDVIVPADNTVSRLIRGNFLQPLDRMKIPNFKNIDPAFRDASFDPGRRFSAPYMWGTVGLGYRTDRVEVAPDSWSHVFDSDEYAGRIALMADDQVLIQMALKYMGHSLSSFDPALIDAAAELIIRQKPNVRSFVVDKGEDMLDSGEVDIAMEWSGDVLQVMSTNDAVDYVVPKEGTLIWQDSLCIPVSARHPENAHRFINYLLDAEVGASIANSIKYATPNAEAFKLMPDDYKKNPAVYPPAEAYSRSEVFTYRGELVQQLYKKAWERIQAA